jgi:hypothetical protein
MRIIACPRIPLINAGRLPRASAALGKPVIASKACGNSPRTTLTVASQNRQSWNPLGFDAGRYDPISRHRATDISGATAVF